jgi:S-adenosyl-L-methionine hydrolase (adenosine-forming)
LTTIAMMTDFGLKDGNVGVMKGVIAGICPDAKVVDVSHLISPQSIPEAALILLRSIPYFPADTIHLVVVDPGVGTRRRPMAAHLGDAYYVGPDNGTITLWLERVRAEGRPCQFVELEKPEYWLPDVSHVFHGRDIFAPTAAHLAAGVSLTQLGTPIADPVELPLPRPERQGATLRGEVIHLDHFGNVASNIRAEHLAEALAEKEKLVVTLAGTRVEGLVDTFGSREPGSLIALIGSTGNLIVSVVNGSAAARLGVEVGTPMVVEFPSATQPQGPGSSQ